MKNLIRCEMSLDCFKLHSRKVIDVFKEKNICKTVNKERCNQGRDNNINVAHNKVCHFRADVINTFDNENCT